MPEELSKELAEMKEALQSHFEAEASKAESRNDVLKTIQHSLYAVKINRPNDRSELDRRYAVVITDLEKAVGYFKAFIVDEYMLGGTATNKP